MGKAHDGGKESVRLTREKSDRSKQAKWNSNCQTGEIGWSGSCFITMKQKDTGQIYKLDTLIWPYL